MCSFFLNRDACVLSWVSLPNVGHVELFPRALTTHGRGRRGVFGALTGGGLRAGRFLGVGSSTSEGLQGASKTPTE